jgi:hypothetical protein
MRLGLFALALAAIALLFFTTKPSRDDFDREFSALVRETVSNSTHDANKGFGAHLAALGCQLRANDCLAILKSAYMITSRDYVLFSQQKVTGPGTTVDCWGLLRQFICTGSMAFPPIPDRLGKIL